jgi:hypothetical protein
MKIGLVGERINGLIGVMLGVTNGLGVSVASTKGVGVLVGAAPREGVGRTANSRKPTQ